MGLIRHRLITPFPTATGTRSWKVVQIIFVLILAPDSPNFNRKEGMALQHFLGGMSVTKSVTNTITNLISYVNQ